jgi:hypothetical protein
MLSTLRSRDGDQMLIQLDQVVLATLEDNTVTIHLRIGTVHVSEFDSSVSAGNWFETFKSKLRDANHAY